MFYTWFFKFFYWKNEWIAHFLFFGERCEWIAQVAHQQWANEWIAHLLSKSLIRLFRTKNEQFARKSNEWISSPGNYLLQYLLAPFFALELLETIFLATLLCSKNTSSNIYPSNILAAILLQVLISFNFTCSLICSYLRDEVFDSILLCYIVTSIDILFSIEHFPYMFLIYDVSFYKSIIAEFFFTTSGTFFWIVESFLLPLFLWRIGTVCWIHFPTFCPPPPSPRPPYAASCRQIQAFQFKALVPLSGGWSQENHLLENLKTSGSMKEPGGLGGFP